MIFFLLFFPICLLANVYFNAKINVNTDFIPTYELLKDWHTYYKKDGTNLALIYNNENLLYQYKTYVIGLLREDFYYIKTNQDTTEFVYLLINNGKIKDNKLYDINLKIYGYSVNGLKFGKIFKYNNFDIFFDLDLLKGVFMQDGKLRGSAITYSNGDYHYSGEADYYYTHNYLYHLKVNRPTSNGYRVNMKMNYSNKFFSYYLTIKNLFGFINWKKLPYSHVHIETNNKDKSKGYIVYKPSIYGVEKYLDYKQKLYPYISSFIGIKNDIVDKFIIGSDYYKSNYFPFLGFQKKFYKIIYNIRYKSIKANIHLKNFYLSLQTNKLNLKKANSLGIGLSYFINF